LTVNTVGSGTVAVEPDQLEYPYGQVVTLTATADADWRFDTWSGDLTGNANPATLTMTSDKVVTATFTEAALAIVSDDFNSCGLNTELWTWTDPVGDATYAMTGTFTQDAWLSISVPANSDHDLAEDGNRAARVMQPISDTDLELEVKFESGLSQLYQMQGVLIEQDADDFLRLEFYSDGSGTRLFAAVFEPTMTIKYDGRITDTNVAPLYMRVRRQGDQWNQSYSYDGIDWTTPVTFTHPLTATAAGPYAANGVGASSPAHTAYIDYFFNTAAPVIPEDGDRNTLTVNVDPIGSGTVDTDPAKASYSCGEVVTLSASANTGWAFDSWSGDLVSTINPISVTMAGSQVITAHFRNVGDYAPVIQVVKEGPASASVGDTVVYTFTLTNDDALGDGSDIDNVSVEDNVAGAATYVSGDDGNDLVLEVGETWIYTASYTIQPDDPDPLVNIVTASGQDVDGDPVSDTDTASVDVMHVTLTPSYVVQNTPYAVQTYTLGLANHGTSADTFDITYAARDTSSLSGVGPQYNWDVLLSTDSVAVGPGVTETLRITVQVPTFETTWVTHTLHLTATSTTYPEQQLTSTLKTHTGGEWDPVDGRWERCRFDYYGVGTVYFGDAQLVYDHIGSQDARYRNYHEGTVFFGDAKLVYDRIGQTCAP
jgi:hypothetical protein